MASETAFLLISGLHVGLSPGVVVTDESGQEHSVRVWGDPCCTVLSLSPQGLSLREQFPTSWVNNSELWPPGKRFIVECGTQKANV